eukprot:1158443-Pelagomonas_calceolata.AAC.6
MDASKYSFEALHETGKSTHPPASTLLSATESNRSACTQMPADTHALFALVRGFRASMPSLPWFREDSEHPCPPPTGQLQP